MVNILRIIARIRRPIVVVVGEVRGVWRRAGIGNRVQPYLELRHVGLEIVKQVGHPLNCVQSIVVSHHHFKHAVGGGEVFQVAEHLLAVLEIIGHGLLPLSVIVFRDKRGIVCVLC